MRMKVFCVVAVSTLAIVALSGQVRGGGSEWLTAQGDAQRTSWIRTDAAISVEALGKPGFELQWKVKLANQARQTNGWRKASRRRRHLFIPLSLVTGSSNNVTRSTTTPDTCCGSGISMRHCPRNALSWRNHRGGDSYRRSRAAGFAGRVVVEGWRWAAALATAAASVNRVRDRRRSARWRSRTRRGRASCRRHPRGTAGRPARRAAGALGAAGGRGTRRGARRGRDTTTPPAGGGRGGGAAAAPGIPGALRAVPAEDLGALGRRLRDRSDGVSMCWACRRAKHPEPAPFLRPTRTGPIRSPSTRRVHRHEQSLR